MNESGTPFFDEYDKALIFALKKWISDEIFSITQSGVESCTVRLCGSDLFFGYTAKELREGGHLDGNDNVSGSVDIWLRFKGLSSDDPKAADMIGSCVNGAASELEADGVIKEKFGRNIPVGFVRG